MASKPRSKAKKAPPAGWLTRIQIADLCKVSPTTIDNWQKRDALHPVLAVSPHSLRPTWYYDPAEVANRMRPSERSAADLAGRAFEMFGRGERLREIMVELHCEPGTVEDLYQQWLDMDGRALAIEIHERRQLEAIVGVFADSDELIAKVRDLAVRAERAETTKADGDAREVAA